MSELQKMLVYAACCIGGTALSVTLGWVIAHFSLLRERFTRKKVLTAKLEKREKEIIHLVNAVLDEMIGAEPGWHEANGRRWQFFLENTDLNFRTLVSPCCMTTKAAYEVTYALKSSGDYISGPKFRELTQGWEWELNLSV